MNTDRCRPGAFLTAPPLALAAAGYFLVLSDLIVPSLELTVHAGEPALLGCVFQSVEGKRVTKVDWTFSPREHAQVTRRTQGRAVAALPGVGARGRGGQVSRGHEVSVQELGLWSASGPLSAWTSSLTVRPPPSVRKLRSSLGAHGRRAHMFPFVFSVLPSVEQRRCLGGRGEVSGSAESVVTSACMCGGISRPPSQLCAPWGWAGAAQLWRRFRGLFGAGSRASAEMLLCQDHVGKMSY